MPVMLQGRLTGFPSPSTVVVGTPLTNSRTGYIRLLQRKATMIAMVDAAKRKLYHARTFESQSVRYRETKR